MTRPNRNEISNIEIVVYSLYILGGWQERIHTEDIALKCFELVPSKFSWIKYPEHPDILPALFALESAAKKSIGSLVEGESERKKTIKSVGGWRLTINGIEWIKINRDRIESLLNKKKIFSKRLQRDRKVNHLINSQAYKKFLTNGSDAKISHAEFAESLICTVNTRSDILEDRLNLIESSALVLENEQLKSYIKFCKEKFKSILKGFE